MATFFIPETISWIGWGARNRAGPSVEEPLHWPAIDFRGLRRNMSPDDVKGARVRGLNHLTLAVTDLERSIRFYSDLLGFQLAARWADGAYLEAGTLWLCLSVDGATRTGPRPDYTHVALDVSEDDFPALSARVRVAAPVWKENRSEGQSLYVLDPDGHKLELHIGSLRSRLAHYRANPAAGRWVAPE